jgi:hypothetical protein
MLAARGVPRPLVNGGAPLLPHPVSIPEAAFLHTNQTLYLTALIGVRSTLFGLLSGRVS